MFETGNLPNFKSVFQRLEDLNRFGSVRCFLLATTCTMKKASAPKTESAEGFHQVGQLELLEHTDRCWCLFLRMQSSRCQYDYIEVYDGPPHSSPLLGRICAGSFLTYTSSSNLMSVRFHSDSRYTSRGFQAHYSSIPADHNIGKFLFRTETTA